MKIDPTTLRRPLVESFNCTLRATGQPDIALNLRYVSQMHAVAAIDESNRLVVKHVLGVGDPDVDGYVPPVPLPMMDGQPVFATESAFKCAAILCAAQSYETHDGDDRYSIIDFIMLMQIDEYASCMLDAYEKVMLGKKKAQGLVSVTDSSITASSD